MNLPISLTGLVSGWFGFPSGFGRAAVAGPSERLWLRRTDFSTQDLVGTIAASGGNSLGFTIPTGQTTLDVAFALDYAADETFTIELTSGDGMNVFGYLQVPDLETVTPPTGFDLTTLGSVKQQLKITDSSFDTYLSDLITRVSQRMQTDLDRLVNTNSVSGEKVSSIGDHAIRLQGFPIQDITALSIYGEAQDLASLDIDSEAGLVYRLEGNLNVNWPRGIRHISADYSYGFTSTPADLQQAADEEVAIAFAGSQQNDGRLGMETSVPFQGGTATYHVGAWLPQTRQVLRKYRDLVA